MSSNFNSIFASDEYILRFLKRRINPENNDEKALFRTIFIWLLGHTLLRLSIYAPSFAPNQKPRNTT